MYYLLSLILGTGNGGFGKHGHQMAVASLVLKSKYILKIHFYTVHSIILCIHSKASIKFINPFQIVVRLLNLIMYMKTNK